MTLAKRQVSSEEEIATSPPAGKRPHLPQEYGLTCSVGVKFVRAWYLPAGILSSTGNPAANSSAKKKDPLARGPLRTGETFAWEGLACAPAQPIAETGHRETEHREGGRLWHAAGRL